MERAGTALGRDIESDTARSAVDGLRLQETQNTVRGFVLEQARHALDVAPQRRLVERGATSVVLAVNVHTCRKKRCNNGMLGGDWAETMWEKIQMISESIGNSGTTNQLHEKRTR